MIEILDGGVKPAESAAIIASLNQEQKVQAENAFSAYSAAVPESQPPIGDDFQNRYAIRARLWLAASIVIIVPAGFASKFYDGPAEAWVNNSLGGVLYVVFFCLLGGMLVPNRRFIAAIVVAVLVTTCALETLQLWNPEFLQVVRRTFIGRTLIGTTFTPWDYLYYFIGAAVGWVWMHVTIRK